MSNLVIIPTYKEKENISAMIKSISELPVKFDILIIDDNSPDGTASIVKEMQLIIPEPAPHRKTWKAGPWNSLYHRF